MNSSANTPLIATNTNGQHQNHNELTFLTFESPVLMFSTTGRVEIFARIPQQVRNFTITSQYVSEGAINSIPRSEQQEHGRSARNVASSEVGRNRLFRNASFSDNGTLSRQERDGDIIMEDVASESASPR